MPDPLADELDNLHTATGFKRLNPVWAKGEILLGLIGTGCGLLLKFRAAQSSDLNLPLLRRDWRCSSSAGISRSPATVATCINPTPASRRTSPGRHAPALPRAVHEHPDR